MRCNLCGNDEFIDMNKRPQVKCAKCNSLERTRLLWMYLQKLNIDRRWKILHFSPQKGLLQALSGLVDEKNYFIADVKPMKFRIPNQFLTIDLCDLDHEPSCRYDLIIHSHVLEHTPCNIAYTLFHLHRMLKNEGRHVCIIPFAEGKYDECFQQIGDKEREIRFGQHDHVRLFGRADIGSHVGKLLRLPEEFDATKDFDAEDLRAANIPENCWKGFHESTVLILKKDDMKLFSGSRIPEN